MTGTLAPPDDPLVLPRTAAPPPRPPLPLLTAVVPIVGAVVLWAVTGSPYALLFAALGPLIAVASVADAARGSRRSRRKDAAATARELDAARSEVARRHGLEREERWARHPDVTRYLARPESIWRAVPGRQGMLVVGTGEGQSGVRLTGGEGDAAATDVRRRAGRLSAAPVTVPMTTGIAVVGPPALAAAAARALAVQACLCLPPGELRLADGMPAWADALPHHDAASGLLLQLLEAGGIVGGEVDVPIVVVPDGAPPPPRCGAVVRVTAPDRARLDVDGVSQEVVVEMLGDAQAAALARSLADRAEQALGRAVEEARTLGDLQDALPAAAPGALPAAFASTGGVPFVVDLVADGPHAVLIGMTGAGKSELLTSWVVSLCAAHTPEQVALLLVDFKGGRTFDHLAQLPHVTGVLTDLDEGTTLRAVESLRAEVRHRERLLADLGARDVSEAAGGLGRLVIVVDEYAALVATHPALHDLFGDLAARGRALGIHLVLAAQRAAGVFRDGVMANAPLRIALRVADGADSRAILGVDDAARLSGRAGSRGTALVRRSSDTAPHVVRVALCERDMLEGIGTRTAPPARRPWLPALAPSIPLEEMRAEGAVVLGVADEPDMQRQGPFAWPVDDAALAVLGGPGSGRTGVLRAIAAQARVSVVPSEPEAAWDALTALDRATPGTTLLIDDVDALLGRLPGDYAAAAVEAIEETLRSARSRGLRVVLTAQRLSGGTARLVDLIPRRLILGTATRADHVAAGGDAADFAADQPRGRGRMGRTLVQVVSTDRPLPSPAAVPAPMWLPGRRPAAVVVPAGSRTRRLVAEWQRLGIRVRPVSAEAAPVRGEVIVGPPDAWLAQWRLLAAVRSDADLVVDAACAGEYRATVGSRDLPPFARAGAGRAWVHAPDRPVRRVVLSAGEVRPSAG